MATKISDTRSKAVYRETDEPITEDGRRLAVGIVLGDRLSLRPVGRRHDKRVPIGAIYRHADMLASEDGRAPKLTATTNVVMKDGPTVGQVIVTLSHADTLSFRIKGSKRTFDLSIERAYLQAVRAAVEAERREKQARKKGT